MNAPLPASAPDDYREIAEKVRSGEYFQEARRMYDLAVHDPMAERYVFLLISLISTLIACIALMAIQFLYPLQTPVPFIVNSANIIDDLPRMKSLVAHKGEDASAALLRFMTNNYVTFREEYDIETFDRNISGIRSQSSEPMFKSYERQIDPHNPESPIILYQRHSVRTVNILSSHHLADQGRMEIVFEATVENKNETKKTRWQANIAFNYSGIALDEETGKVKPVTFLVTDYRTKRL